MGNNKEKDSITFKMTISARANPELFAELKDAGPYYRAKIVLPLAQLGLTLRKGGVQPVMAQISTPT